MNGASRYLAAADDMLSGGGTYGAIAVTTGWWPRACACLIRMALEAGIDEYWCRTAPPVAKCGSGRTKLLMLRRRLPRDLVRQATHAWRALSRATHHHCYEAAPSAVELRRLHADTASIVAALQPWPAPISISTEQAKPDQRAGGCPR